MSLSCSAPTRRPLARGARRRKDLMGTPAPAVEARSQKAVAPYSSWPSSSFSLFLSTLLGTLQMLCLQYWPTLVYLHVTRDSWQAAASDPHFRAMHAAGGIAFLLCFAMGCLCDALLCYCGDAPAAGAGAGAPPRSKQLLSRLASFLAARRCQPYSLAPGPTAVFGDALPVALANGLLGHWPASVPLFRLWQHRGGSVASASFDHSSYGWGRAAADFAIMAAVIECWFYWSHRLLHQKLRVPSPLPLLFSACRRSSSSSSSSSSFFTLNLYALVHKQHHRFTAPTALCAAYAHPLEFCLGNYAGVALGPALVGAPVRVAAAWYALCICGTCFTHSGYALFNGGGGGGSGGPGRSGFSLLDSAHHDLHHEYFNCNYGVSSLLDDLFGTSGERARGSGGRTFAEMKEQRSAAFATTTTTTTAMKNGESGADRR